MTDELSTEPVSTVTREQYLRTAETAASVHFVQHEQSSWVAE